MKKFLVKIALFSFISILMNIFSVNYSFADETDAEMEAAEAELAAQEAEINAATQVSLAELSIGIDDAEKDQCVNEYVVNNEGNKDNGPDAGYIIMRVEEPLDINPSGTTGPDGDDYVQRRCFQNTFKYFDPHSQKERIVETLSKICSNNAKTLVNKYGETEYKAQLSCREIMVILTKGGTTAIYGYIGMIYRWAASLVGIIAVTVIIFSGIQISASGGDTEAIGAGKKRILQSLLGIIVLFLSGLILYTVNPNFFVR